jgi:hypothetical protein
MSTAEEREELLSLIFYYCILILRYRFYRIFLESCILGRWDNLIKKNKFKFCYYCYYSYKFYTKVINLTNLKQKTRYTHITHNTHNNSQHCHFNTSGLFLIKVTIISPKKLFAHANHSLVMIYGLCTLNDSCIKSLTADFSRL